MNCIRAVILKRSGATFFRHVKAHSGAGDIRSKMNEVADLLANKARLAAVDDILPYDLPWWGRNALVSMWRGFHASAATEERFSAGLLRFCCPTSN
jgi:hypothetical protein